jgi:hypothetical protein
MSRYGFSCSLPSNTPPGAQTAVRSVIATAPDDGAESGADGSSPASDGVANISSSTIAQQPGARLIVGRPSAGRSLGTAPRRPRREDCHPLPGSWWAGRLRDLRASARAAVAFLGIVTGPALRRRDCAAVAACPAAEHQVALPPQRLRRVVDCTVRRPDSASACPYACRPALTAPQCRTRNSAGLAEAEAPP